MTMFEGRGIDDTIGASTAGQVTTLPLWEQINLPINTQEYRGWYEYRTKYADDAGIFNAQVQRYGDRWLKLTWYAKENGSTPEWVESQMYTYNLFPDRSVTGRGPGGGGPTKAQQYAAAEAAIRNQAYTLGYTTLQDPQIKALAKTVVDQNWSSEQLMDKLVNDATGNWDAITGGTLKAAIDAVKAGAADQLIGISDNTARQWAKRIASGEMDMDGLRNILQTQAIARYGWAADVIQSGVSMADFLAPSRDRIAQELELNATDINMTDPKVLDMVTVVDSKGQRRVANDVELLRNARKDERWKSTGNARNMLSQAAMMIRRYVEGN